MDRNTFSAILKVTVVAGSCMPLFCVAGPVQHAYEYDSLGRLVKVHENGVEKAGYCYDAGGNRIKVNSAGGNCTIAPPAPPKPTALSQATHQGGGCYITWASVSGVAKFEIKIRTASVATVDGSKRYYDHNTRCFEWIRACTVDNICSEQAYF